MSSGLSGPVYARKHGIGSRSLYLWRKKGISSKSKMKPCEDSGEKSMRVLPVSLVGAAKQQCINKKVSLKICQEGLEVHVSGLQKDELCAVAREISKEVFGV